MKNRNGFTLIELAMVLFIIGLVMGGMMVPLATAIDGKRLDAARNEAELIKEAMVSYAIQYGALPCPSQIADRADLNWGKSGDCSLEGYVPWADIGLSPMNTWGEGTAEQWRMRVDQAFAVTFRPNTAPSDNLVVSDATGQLLTSGDPRCFDSGDSLVVCNGPYSRREEPRYTPAIIFNIGENGVADGENAAWEASPCSNSTGYGTTVVDPLCWGKPLYQGGAWAEDFDDVVDWLSHPAMIYRMVASGAF